jgi:hypothetical protein
MSNKKNIKILCKCGCGLYLYKYDSRGREKLYLYGHSLNNSRNGFKKNNIPWNKNTKGLIKPNKTSFKKGIRYSKETEFKKGQISWNKGKHPEYLQGENHPMFGKKLSIETRKKISIAHTGVKLSPEHIRKSLGKRGMSGTENRVLHIINKYNLPYKFVGDGKFLIENKCPDFIDTNKKIAVEVYWKKHKDLFRGNCENWIKERKNIFKRNGWKTIFIECSNLTENKVLYFLQNKGGGFYL